MATERMKARERKLLTKYNSNKRDELRAIIKDKSSSPDEIIAAVFKMQTDRLMKAQQDVHVAVSSADVHVVFIASLVLPLLSKALLHKNVSSRSSKIKLVEE